MSITPNSPILLAIALGLGLLIGLERELRKGSGSHRGAAGVRTFALAGLAGALSSYLNSEALLVAVAAGAVLFSALAYRHTAPKDSGLTCGAQKFHSMVSNEMSHCYIASVSCGIMGEMTIRQRQAQQRESVLWTGVFVVNCDQVPGERLTGHLQ